MTPSASLEIALAILCALVVLVGPAVAQQQRLMTSFGPYVETVLDFHPLAVCVSASPVDPHPLIAVLSPEHPILRFYRLTEAARISEVGSYDLPAQQSLLIAGDGDTTGVREYFMLSREGNAVTRVRQTGDRFATTRLPLKISARKMVVSDIDNNGVRDLLLFGRTTTGVATLLGRADGSFAPGPLLFPEISVSDLKTVDLNGDGIADVILLDWLTNRIIIYYGITRAIFTEQVSLTLPGEPDELAIEPVTRRRTLRIAVTIPQAHQLVFVTADAAGDMEIAGMLDLPARPNGVSFASINADPWRDIVSVTDRGTVVGMGTQNGDFQPVTLFGPGKGSTSWTVADVDGDRHPDILLADASTNRLIVLGNARRTSHTAWPEAYAVGPGPRGISVHDFDGDGHPDICVANAGSSTISFLLNRGDGKMAGAISASVPQHPGFVTTARTTGSPDLTIVTAHPDNATLAVLKAPAAIGKSEFLALPTNAHPSVLFARQGQGSSGLVILVRNEQGRRRALSLSLFEQLTSGQFLERSLRTNIAQRILALTVDDFTGARGYDLAYVTNDRSTSISTVSLSRGTTGFGFGAGRPLFSYEDSTASTRAILSGRVDADSYADLLLVLGPPRNTLAVAYGRGDGTFRDSLAWIPDVRPARDGEIVFRDVNQDGTNDIVFLDDERNAVIALYGRGNGRFQAPAIVAPGDGVTGLAVAPLRREGVDDLILSHGERGIVTVHVSPFVRGKK